MGIALGQKTKWAQQSRRIHTTNADKPLQLGSSFRVRGRQNTKRSNKVEKHTHTHTLHYTTHDIESWELGEVSLVAKGARPTSSGSEIWLDNSFGSPSLRACFWAWESTGTSHPPPRHPPPCHAIIIIMGSSSALNTITC